MRRADEIRQQLKRYVKRYSRGCPLESNFESIRKCIVSSELDSSGQYRTVKDRSGDSQKTEKRPLHIGKRKGGLKVWQQEVIQLKQ